MACGRPVRSSRPSPDWPGTGGNAANREAEHRPRVAHGSVEAGPLRRAPPTLAQGRDPVHRPAWRVARRPRTRARARAEARRRGRSGFFSQRPVMVALATLVIAQVYGIDANPLMFSVVALAVVILGWYVWFAVVGVLVGAWFRWRGG